MWAKLFQPLRQIESAHAGQVDIDQRNARQPRRVCTQPCSSGVRTDELSTEAPIEQTLSLVTFGDPSPAMKAVIEAARRAAEKVM